MSENVNTVEAQAAERGVAAVSAFIDAFNALDHDGLAATLNYPHVRLANGRFATVEDAETFARRSRNNESALLAEGWHHTETGEVSVVHAGVSKVHIAMAIDRCDAGGNVYKRFETLWIATRQDGHWGIQFRSSYLR